MKATIIPTAERDELIEALKIARTAHDNWSRCLFRTPKTDSNTVFVDARDWHAYRSHSDEATAKIDAALARAGVTP